MKIQINNLNRPKPELEFIGEVYRNTLTHVFGSTWECKRIHDEFNRAGKPPFHDWNAANQQARDKVKDFFRLTPTEYQDTTYTVRWDNE